ncbi:hypothetical protein PHJA_000523800 [Phtheirospermum japonicum]|uniref:Uncharacterized protein n=1 Tax=Phtheirospermum japonicum TaxID=374723 RepID=A0A830BI34_9LAMI|nr:hypothetical protein PHJA_000523800 [Phtheirospermum japonicum]
MKIFLLKILSLQWKDPYGCHYLLMNLLMKVLLIELICRLGPDPSLGPLPILEKRRGRDHMLYGGPMDLEDDGTQKTRLYIRILKNMEFMDSIPFPRAQKTRLDIRILKNMEFMDSIPFPRAYQMVGLHLLM